MVEPARHPRRTIRRPTYAIFFFLFALLLFLTHLPLINLPYFWDEATQYIPSTLDLYHDGSWIPHSVGPIIHPPAVMAYVAVFWKIAGCHPAVTRSAMLLLAALGVLAAFLLAIELSREARGRPALLVAALLCASPVFFSQALLVQLDMPALVFTTLALLLFLQNKVRASAAVCVILALSKETGIVVPLVFAGWLGYERRWREAAWFAAPVLALAGWLGVLKSGTGSWMGSAGFAEYNLFYPLHPVRLLVALLRRLYYLFVANFHWVGTVAIFYAWRRSSLFFSRSWRIAWLLAAAHIMAVTVLGGAVLERYLLPVLPIVYTAMAAGILLFPLVPQRICAAVLLCGVAVANYINPPYPFPYENNLAFADFLKLQMDATEYVERWYPSAEITTASPTVFELTRPELGFVKRRLAVQWIANFSPAVLDTVDWSKVQVLLAFSRSWDPPFSFMHSPLVLQFWHRFYGSMSNARLSDVRSRVPFPIEQHIERRGQWVDIYVHPGTPRNGPPEERRAAR